MIQDLSRQIIKQINVIPELWCKLAIIRDVSSDGKNIHSRNIMKNESIIRNITKVNIWDVSDSLEGDMEDVPSSNSKCENVINLHFG